MIEFLGGRSYLFSGELTNDIFQHNKVLIVDLLVVEMADIGVKELRQVISQANERPFGERRLLWLKNMRSPTDVIQDTLLKILEEPPSALIIVVQAENPEELLPSIRSRLHIIRGVIDLVGPSDPVLPVNKRELDQLLRSFKERSELVNLLTTELKVTRKMFLDKPSPILSKRIQELTKALSRLRQNCNQKMVVDSFLLHWAASSGKA